MDRSDRDNFIKSFVVVWILVTSIAYGVFGVSFLLAVIVGIIVTSVVALVVHYPYLLHILRLWW